jgi:hypothetical protein
MASIKMFPQFDRAYTYRSYAFDAEYMETLTATMSFRVPPNAVMLGNGEIWACFNQETRDNSSFYLKASKAKYIS